MAIEQYTESLTLGNNGWGYAFPQGDVAAVDKVNNLLKKAGGKSKEVDTWCEFLLLLSIWPIYTVLHGY